MLQALRHAAAASKATLWKLGKRFTDDILKDKKRKNKKRGRASLRSVAVPHLNGAGEPGHHSRRTFMVLRRKSQQRQARRGFAKAEQMQAPLDRNGIGL